MQLAARVEKLDPPTIEEICAAAVAATVALVTDERSVDGEWMPALDAWQGGGRIRKIVRRARGAAWERAQDVDGATALVGRAEVRAFVPSPTDRVPESVAKLQIRSTDLPEPDRVRELPEPALAPTMLVALTPDVDMSWGKRAAQAAHAGQVLWRTEPLVGDWEVRVVHPTAALWASVLERSPAHIHDGGFTEIPAGTLTAAALWLPAQD